MEMDKISKKTSSCLFTLLHHHLPRGVLALLEAAHHALLGSKSTTANAFRHENRPFSIDFHPFLALFIYFPSRHLVVLQVLKEEDIPEHPLDLIHPDHLLQVAAQHLVHHLVAHAVQLRRLQRHQPVLHGPVLQQRLAAVQLPGAQRLEGHRGHGTQVVHVWHGGRHHGDLQLVPFYAMYIDHIEL